MANDDGTVFICERCREVVDESDVAVLRATELIATPVFGGDQDDVIEGLTVFFHKGCWTPGPRHRLTQ